MGSGNRTDRKEAVEFASVRGSTTIAHRDDQPWYLLPPEDTREYRDQESNRQENNVNEPNKLHKIAGGTTTVKLAISLDGGDRNSDSHRGRSIGTPRAKD
jgi:hypothetical protein